jgi:PTH1 family peptidyl-tRNA hydrolase
MAVEYVIAGLGNPGAKYTETRHNAGFWFLDELARASGTALRSKWRLHAEVGAAVVSGHECLLLKPTRFMNDSGRSVRAALDYYGVPADRLVVAYDELDLPPGVARFKWGGGHGGHNGLRDIFRHVPDHEFLRIRIGIGHPGHKDAVTPYVLGRPGREDDLAIRRAIGQVLQTLPLALDDDLPAAMKQLHTDK